MKNRLLLFLLTFSISAVFIALTFQKKTTPEKLGWKLAYQSYTFKNFTFEEGLQKANTLGLKYVEAYRSQPLSASNANHTHYNSDAATRAEMKRLLKQYKVELVNFGVVRAANDAEWKQIFDFAKEMGIQTITAEPEPEHLDYIEKLCDSYKINLALHNHPNPSRYWSPDTVLHYLQGRSNRLGACADIGHWVRSGLDPVECLKKLEGRIISLHFKDLNAKDRQAHDVPWGTGVCNVPAVLQELKDQGFKGVFSIEYEHNWDNNVPEIAESLKNFRAITAALK
jgi:sugar phosphate isomerase/epimerase